MAFLTARWSNLCLFTYPVPAGLLAPRLPPGLELDTRPEFEGQGFVSLVAFDFLETKVLGVAWPGYRNFAEINLRFYVRRATPGGVERGVVFVREYVPQRLVALMARALYNEPYVAAPLQSRVDRTGDAIEVRHRLTVDNRVNTITLFGNGPAACPTADSAEHFFKEHRWGYGTSRSGKLIRYEVVHPTWDCYRVRTWDLRWDWRSVYGPEWAFLEDRRPVSVVLAVGSEISVFPKAALATGLPGR